MLLNENFFINYSCNQNLNSEDVLIFFSSLCKTFFYSTNLWEKLAKTHINSKCSSSFPCLNPVIRSWIIFFFHGWSINGGSRRWMFLMCYPLLSYGVDWKFIYHDCENFIWNLLNWIRFSVKYNFLANTLIIFSCRQYIFRIYVNSANAKHRADEQTPAIYTKMYF